LTHVYSPGTPFEFRAIDDITLKIEEGSFVGIIGHTGSGKSTLISHFNGLLKPTSGRVLLHGRDIWEEPKQIKKVRFKVGLVFQFPEHQLFEETVAKDIAFGPANMGLSRDEIEQRVAKAVEITGIDKSLLSKSPFELSGGQRRRVAIAGVLAMEPDLLILDEPTAGLDPRGREDVLSYIKNYHAEGRRAVIIVSHNMDDIARVADRIIVLSKGKIQLDGTPPEVFAHRSEIEASGLKIPFVSRVMHRLKAMGVDVEPSVYNMDAAVAMLTALKNGGVRNA
jgi:energy-coupling factor transport system ATP-binding protein